MPSPIKILENIQKIDLEIGVVEAQEKDYERDIETITEGLKALQSEMDAIDAQVNELAEPLREIEERLRKAKERIEKDQVRLNSVKGDRELKALNKEIKTAEKVKRQAEKEAEEFRAKITERKVVREAKEMEAERKSEEVERLTGELDEKKAGWQKTYEEKKAEREALKASLGVDIMSRYENIRSRRGGRAVVPLVKEACHGCYMHVPPQLAIRLSRGDEEIITCPHCHRILYVEEEAEPEAI
ncbi:MAG: zinc ribbon domain-containing protein [Thermodesulfobacteriota bacterium]|nr:MAG: zinc ribbon domain-containing protein [Thermodesulfobacteriota bacterium]